MYLFAESATKSEKNWNALYFHSSAGGIISQTNFFELQKVVGMFKMAYYYFHIFALKSMHIFYIHKIPW